MIIGKITINGITYNISNKNDLNKIEQELTIQSLLNDKSNKLTKREDALIEYYKNPTFYKEKYGYDNLSDNIHNLKDKLQIHPMLEKYNLMDYLFTQ